MTHISKKSFTQKAANPTWAAEVRGFDTIVKVDKKTEEKLALERQVQIASTSKKLVFPSRSNSMVLEVPEEPVRSLPEAIEAHKQPKEVQKPTASMTQKQPLR